MQAIINQGVLKRNLVKLGALIAIGLLRLSRRMLRKGGKNKSKECKDETILRCLPLTMPIDWDWQSSACVTIILAGLSPVGWINI
jgi:hypothetical protein